MASDYNEGVIAEFRGNHGRVSGSFEGAPLLLLQHIGAKTRKQRVNPLMYLRDGDRILVFASKGGADKNPHWYHNLKAFPDVKVEVGDSLIEVHAEEVTGEERDRLYSRQVSLRPQFGEYQRKTKRVIPVIALTPRAPTR